MADGGAEITAGGNLKRAKYSDVCNWVKRSWKAISDEIIINSFVNCSITDSLDDDELEISNYDDDNIHNNDSHVDDSHDDDDNDIHDDNDDHDIQ